MDLYSITLALAMVAAGASTAAALASTVFGRALRAGARARLLRVAWLAAWSGLVLALLSLSIHLATGHRPGTPDAMAPRQLVSEHPALFGVLLLAALLLGAAAALRRRASR